MAHEVMCRLILQLDDDPPVFAGQLSTVSSNWATFLTGIAPLQGEATFVVEQAAAPQPPRVRRSRRAVQGVSSDGAEEGVQTLRSVS